MSNLIFNLNFLNNTFIQDIFEFIIKFIKNWSSSVNVEYSGKTDIGQKRKTNQDSICLLPEKDFFAVADGMGGHNGGDIASQMSVELLKEEIISQSEISEEKLTSTIQKINKEVYNHGQKNKELRGMGTTISAVQFDQKFLNLINVGDSRIYLIHKGKLFQMTRDHSLVQEKLNLGIYDREGAKRDPQKNVLIRTIGFEEDVEVDYYKYRLHDNDIVLICSDGLHGKVCDEDILKIVNQHINPTGQAQKKDLDDAVEHLIFQANLNGGQDNISVILVYIK